MLTFCAHWFVCFHQVVGSSILIIYDSKHVGAWIIDFAKTLPLPEGVTVTHRLPWRQGNHEEGYLTGLDNLIEVSYPPLNRDRDRTRPASINDGRA